MSAWTESVGGIAAAVLVVACTPPPARMDAGSDASLDAGVDAHRADSSIPAGAVGPAGGEVRLPDGARLLIPAGALDEVVFVSIEALESDSAEFIPPRTLTVRSPVYRFGPAGLSFRVPATVVMPIDASAAEELAVYWTDRDGASVGVLPSTTTGATIEADISHFSHGFVATVDAQGGVSVHETSLGCFNGLDDDGDGCIDCGDADCSCEGDPNWPPEESDCADGIDNECDGLTDCEDFEDCADSPSCCGAVDQRCCESTEPSEQCTGLARCGADGFCSPCGSAGEICCPESVAEAPNNGCVIGTCVGGMCDGCGGPHAECCPPLPGRAGRYTADGRCLDLIPASSGSWACDGGSCLPCGSSGALCCDPVDAEPCSATDRSVCRGDRCVGCGTAGAPCCESGSPCISLGCPSTQVSCNSGTCVCG